MYVVYKISGSRRKKFKVKFVESLENIKSLVGENLAEEAVSKRIGVEIDKGKEKYFIQKATLSDYILYGMKRVTQIVYPRDGYIIASKLGIFSSDKVFEAGIGSGSLTLILGEFLRNGDGKIISFEKNIDHINLAKKNIEKWMNFTSEKFNHEIKNVDIVEENFEDEYLEFFDKGVLDIKFPEKVVEKMWKILKPGGILVVRVVTTNQVSQVLKVYNNKFFVKEIIDVSITERTNNPDRFRKVDLNLSSKGFIITLIKKSVE